MDSLGDRLEERVRWALDSQTGGRFLKRFCFGCLTFRSLEGGIYIKRGKGRLFNCVNCFEKRILFRSKPIY